MELCEADVRRLERRGYDRLDFSELGEDRILRLRNRKGFCFFFDKRRRRCKEYSARPLGCRIYPVNLGPDGEVILDDLYPAAGSISPDERERNGKRLIRLLAVIDKEADDRSRPCHNPR